MDYTKSKNSLLFNKGTRLLKWFRRTVFIIIAAVMIGFTNAFYNENRMVNDTMNFDEQEQVHDKEE